MGVDELSPDDVFDVLRNARRRYVLRALQQVDSIQLGTLAERIAAREHQTTVDRVSSSERKSVYTSLYQTHLPKLADQGVIDYDRDRGVIELTEAATQLEAFLDLPTDERRWSKRYLALTIAAWIALLGYGIVGSTLPLTVLAAIFVFLVVLLGVAVAHRRDT